MIKDQYGLLVMEHVSYPGNIGDSCAETCRYFHINRNATLGEVEAIRNFRTDTGYIRHPDAPVDWREKDFSSDQATPLYLSFVKYDLYDYALEFESRVRAAGWRTGNGDILPLIWITIFRRAHNKQTWASDIPLLLQSLTLRFLPFRWNDERKTVESTADSSSDWINHFHVLFQAAQSPTWISKLARLITPHNLIMGKVRHYYNIEPNVQFLLYAYETATI